MRSGYWQTGMGSGYETIFHLLHGKIVRNIILVGYIGGLCSSRDWHWVLIGADIVFLTYVQRIDSYIFITDRILNYITQPLGDKKGNFEN